METITFEIEVKVSATELRETVEKYFDEIAKQINNIVDPQIGKLVIVFHE